MTMQAIFIWLLFAHLLAFWVLAVVLWLGAELLGVDDIRFVHAAFVSLGVVGASGLLLLGVGLAESHWRVLETLKGGAGWLSGLISLQLAASYLILRYGLPTSPARALTLCLMGLFVVLSGGMLVAVGLRSRVMDFAPVASSGGAPLVLPAHVEVTCPNCGREFPASASPRNESAAAMLAVCPNCGQALEIGDEMPTLPPDYVLVDKAAKPTRWQMVAYRPTGTGPGVQIGRVIGMPGDTLQIIGGDVFAKSVRLVKDIDKFPEVWQTVHDSGFVPQEPLPDGPAWQAEPPPASSGASPWKYEGGNWSCATKGRSILSFNRPITNRDPYNATIPGEFAPGRPVRDVAVTCTVQSFQGAGYLGLFWSYGDTSIAARLTLNGNNFNLLAKTPPVEGETGDAAPPPRPQISRSFLSPPQLGDTFTLGMRDGNAFLLHNGQTLALLPIEPPDAETAAKRETRLQRLMAVREGTPWEPNKLQILVEEGTVHLGRILIQRDAFYESLHDLNSEAPDRATVGLEPNEFWLLANNSTRELDSRHYGPIDKRHLLGPVRWVCWPRERWKPVP